VWTGDAVTTDGRILTANGPEAATEFGEALGDLLGLERI
jgi:putative intracellular protease/amidase